MPVDTVVRHGLDRYHLIINAVTRVPPLEHEAPRVRNAMTEKLAAHQRYIVEHGEGPPAIRDWKRQPTPAP